jgi:hypothetical protein
LLPMYWSIAVVISFSPRLIACHSIRSRSLTSASPPTVGYPQR